MRVRPQVSGSDRPSVCRVSGSATCGRIRFGEMNEGLLRNGTDTTRPDMEQTLDEVLETLTERERDILKARFMGEMTLETIAARYGKTREAIRLVECKALKKLRHPERLHKLETVWGASK